MQPGLPGPVGQPPFSLHVGPDAHLVIGLSAGALAVGALGVALGLLAARAGWTPSPRPLLIAGLLAAVALALVPPFGSGDHLNYAAYGRMVTLGHNPYTTAAIDLPGDPIADAVEPPWREEVSVYGPLATAEQALASWLGGDSVRLTVFVLALLNAAAFAVTGWLLYRYARDRAARLRTLWLWTLNPLLLYQLVSGLHVDTLSILATLAALLALRRSAAGAGVLLGLAVAVKATVGLALGGLLWVRRGSRRTVAIILGCFIGTAGIGYAAGGPHVLDQTRSAARMVSLAVPWHLVAPSMDGLLGHGTSRQIISILTIAVTVGLVVGLLRVLPPVTEDVETALRVSVALCLAWLFASSYALPWYGGLGWALLALLPATRLDGVLLARTLIISLAYLPARTVPLPDDLGWLLTVGRAQIAPWLLTGVLAVLVMICLRAPRLGAPRRIPAPDRS